MLLEEDICFYDFANSTIYTRLIICFVVECKCWGNCKYYLHFYVRRFLIPLESSCQDFRFSVKRAQRFLSNFNLKRAGTGDSNYKAAMFMFLRREIMNFRKEGFNFIILEQRAFSCIL